MRKSRTKGTILALTIQTGIDFEFVRFELGEKVVRIDREFGPGDTEDWPYISLRSSTYVIEHNDSESPTILFSKSFLKSIPFRIDLEFVVKVNVIAPISPFELIDTLSRTNLVIGDRQFMRIISLIELNDQHVVSRKDFQGFRQILSAGNQEIATINAGFGISRAQIAQVHQAVISLPETSRQTSSEAYATSLLLNSCAGLLIWKGGEETEHREWNSRLGEAEVVDISYGPSKIAILTVSGVWLFLDWAPEWDVYLETNMAGDAELFPMIVGQIAVWHFESHAEIDLDLLIAESSNWHTWTVEQIRRSDLVRSLLLQQRAFSL